MSLIDREGRSLVKCSSYQACNEVRKNLRIRNRYSLIGSLQVRRVVERITGRRGSKPLKVTFKLGP